LPGVRLRSHARRPAGGLQLDHDGGEQFNWAREDGEAACFDDHVDAIEECLMCADFGQFTIDHSIYTIQYDTTTFDVESEGGGYSAYIELTIKAAECCPAS
jgi:hypothetical protein